MKKNGVEHSPMPVPGETGIPARHRERPGGGDPASQNGNGAVIAEKIGQSIAYMKQHLDKPLNVSTLTALAGLSPSHFFDLFKRATGHTPIGFFIRLRMCRACELLEQTGLSVKEVAASLGYDDQFYFSRVFKSVNRMAPSEYRARLAGAGRTKTTAAPICSERPAPEAALPQLPVFEPFMAQVEDRRIIHAKIDDFYSHRERGMPH